MSDIPSIAGIMGPPILYNDNWYNDMTDAHRSISATSTAGIIANFVPQRHETLYKTKREIKKLNKKGKK